jgi:hypothetical protein
MKKVFSNLVAVADVLLNPARAVSTAAFNIVPLAQNQYIRVLNMTALLEGVKMTTTPYLTRVDTLVHAVSDSVKDRVIAADNISVSVAPQSMIVANFSTFIRGDGTAVVSDTNGLRFAVGRLGMTDLDAVAAGVGLNALVRRGNLTEGHVICHVEYDVLSLSDSERIEIMQRCECQAVD